MGRPCIRTTRTGTHVPLVERKSPSLSSYLTADHRIRMDNYLVRVFSDEFHSDIEEIRPETLDSALGNLKLFDLV